MCMNEPSIQPPPGTADAESVVYDEISSSLASSDAFEAQASPKSFLPWSPSVPKSIKMAK